MRKNQVFNLKDVEIYTINNFLSQEECKAVCNLIDENHIRSSVAGKGKEKVEYVSARTSSSSFLNQDDPVVKEVDQRISNLLGLPAEKGEPMQGQLYHASEFYDDHFDFFIGDGFTNHCLASGQRTWTVMIYLNNVPSGGNTEFPELGKIFQPVEGTAVVWKNSDGTGRENHGTLHSGRPVIEGKKYIITKWFREHAFNPEEDQRLAAAKHQQQSINPISDKEGNPVPIEWVGGIPHARFKSNKDIPAITEEGFSKRQIPAPLFAKIKSYYEERRKASIPEFDPEKRKLFG
jgi:prolyl 4-hydroxylase